jgi:hypothetical protein
MPAFGSPIPLPIPTFLRTRGVVNFIRWSSTSRRRHRTMAANPIIRLGSKRAHTETTVLGQLKKSQQNRAPAWESCHITGKRFVGPRNLPDQLTGCSGLCPLDPINLGISNERAQGHFLSPWSKSGALYTKEPRYSLCVYASVRSEKTYCWCFDFFFLSSSLLDRRNKRHCCSKKMGGGGGGWIWWSRRRWWWWPMESC